jgi:multidrug efflux pump
MILYGFAILAVFLCLAALYESWSIPLAVILVVPLGVLGVLLAITGRGLPNDVYFQVGLITIIGLSAKNAILIIEFAKDLQAQGKRLQAALAAAHLRFRPIIMTSLAFTLGVLPLAIASGAGSASQHAIGTGVMGGMSSARCWRCSSCPCSSSWCAASSRARRASSSATPSTRHRPASAARRRGMPWTTPRPG